jgi:hypothetical protein
MEKKYNLKKKQFEEYFDLAKKSIKQDKYLNNKKIKDEQKKREGEEKKREEEEKKRKEKERRTGSNNDPLSDQ